MYNKYFLLSLLLSTGITSVAFAVNQRQEHYGHSHNHAHTNTSHTHSHQETVPHSKEIGYISETKENDADVLSVSGIATYNNHKIDKTLRVHGSLTGTKLETQNVEVYGTTKLEDSTIKGRSVLRGSLEAKTSHFNQPLEVNGEIVADGAVFDKSVTATGNINLHNSTAHDIFIDDSKRWTKAKVILTGSTIVNGSITFASGKGEVRLQDNAKISGKVVSGQLVIKAQ